MTRTNNTDLKDVWQTPPELLELLPEIDVDPCAGADTDIGAENYRYPDRNGLQNPWWGYTFVNPPFSKKTKFLQKTIEERDNCQCIYVLTPDSTDVQSWWHDYIAEYADYIWFSEGRVSYINPETGQPANNPTFGTAISMFGLPESDSLERFKDSGHLVQTVR